MEPVNKMTVEDQYWLAGLLEGEGCFLLAKSTGRGHRYIHPRVDLAMTDEDVVRRAAAIMGTSVRRLADNQPSRRGHSYKPMWKTTLYSSRAYTLMHSLLPLLGERRQKKVKEIIAEWDRTRALPWGKRHCEEPE